jgi:uncharacterized protein YaaR (DUF327 family)
VKKYLFCLVMVTSLAILAACKKDDNSGCTSSAKRVSAAAQQYAASPTPQNCGIYKTAIQDYLNSSCASGLSQTDRQSLENALNNLGC